MLHHGVADGSVRFGAALWFADVLLRFGYDLPEHEHPWDGEWIDDEFERITIIPAGPIDSLIVYRPPPAQGPSGT